MKKSGVSRVRNKMVLVLVIANAMLFLASVVTKATNLMNLSVLLFLPIMALLIATNRCPHCGNAGLYSAPQTPEEQRRPDTGIMLECRGCGSTFYTDAYLPWPGKIIRRRPTCPEEWEEKSARKQAGPASSGEERRPERSFVNGGKI